MKKKEENQLETERFMVVIPKVLVELLKDEMKKKGYFSIQSVINESIRDRYFEETKPVRKKYKGAKRGPKPKFDHEKMVSGENMFE